MSESAQPTDDSQPTVNGVPAEEASHEASEAAAQGQGEGVESSPEASATTGPELQEDAGGQAVVARYGMMRLMGLFRHELDEQLRPGTKVVVRSERGLELADVVSNVCDHDGAGCIPRSRLDDFIRAAGSEYPFLRTGKLLRLANSQDLIDQRHLDGSAHEETTYCRKQIREMNLEMKLVAAEHLLGGERIIFYFSSESRVDFRELVRRLAAQFRTRIEMRQVGARDEARLVGDLERCGRPCCCRSFLKYLQPISMRMAKTQKATLDPSKISGRCGRLMCCLRYEDAGYEELRAKLPRKNTFVRAADGVVGKVIDTQILTQLVRLVLGDNSHAVVSNEDIVERNVPPPPPPQPAAVQSNGESRRQRRGRAARSESLRAGASSQPPETAEQEQPEAEEPATAQAGADSQPAEGTTDEQARPTEEKRTGRRRRRRRKKRPSGAASNQGPQKPKAQGGQSASADGKSKRRKSRRRRRKKR